ncbi:hypothetical protein M413DRAFT_166072 [Hebeloma cylindrosporum]|uniref:Uncharacterized protein n=1 Tax=Hebeloma cylindrosporum TaxID=76867 RepID=A0A0C2YHZ7_HEBCY|nr:hypothetical protein M413DRAFT_166072 [Hebeloma cylindrosporum h7]
MGARAGLWTMHLAIRHRIDAQTCRPYIAHLVLKYIYGHMYLGQTPVHDHPTTDRHHPAHHINFKSRRVSYTYKYK